MRKCLRIVISLLLLTIVLDAQVYYGEAEQAEYKKLLPESDSQASSGQYLKVLNSGFVRWNVNVSESAWYELSIGYKSPGGGKEEYLVINNVKRAVGFGYSKSWNVFSKRVRLNSGLNTIEISPSWGNIDLDYLRIDTTLISPSLKPLRNNVYHNNPHDLVYKINRFGYEIKGVSSDSVSLKFTLNEYPFQEDAVRLTIPANELSKLSEGIHELVFSFDNSKSLTSRLNVFREGSKADLTIITPYVEHGSAVVFILPTGKTMLVDCAKDWVRDSILIPMLHSNNIEKIDYFFITHYHDDHDSGDKGEDIKQLFNVGDFYDYKSFNTGDTFSLAGVDFKILNSFDDGKDENTSSLSFKMTYNDFVYIHGGDTYGVNQVEILKRFPEDIKADVFYANHHFHGSVDIGYIRAMDPSIVLLQAQEAIYARSAYMDDFKKSVEKYLLRNSDRYIEDLPTLEIGTVVVRINSASDWSYESYPDAINKIPRLK